MKRYLMGLCTLTLLIGGFAVAAPASGAPPSALPPGQAGALPGGDELPNAMEARRRALRQEAISKVLKGDAVAEQRNGSTVVNLGASSTAEERAASGGKGKYVELAREQTDQVFVILVEFGNERHPDYPDQDTDPDTPGPARFDGPLHNEIPRPDRSVNNTTLWRSDFSHAYFNDLYFHPQQESLRTYFETQSSGRYTAKGFTTDWVKVRYNEARYGRSDGYPCDSSVCDNTWALVRDGANQWVEDQKAQGKTTDEISAALAKFDRWDRYDNDGDGDFNEPDGYIDHFQIVHSGGDQADGDPYQGEDAIWSHRWYAYQSDTGLTGPPDNLRGGTQAGDTGIWVGDYTVNPENGGLSTITHEYAHDLGLPDDYDTASGSDDPVGWWTLMCQSRLSGRGEPLGKRSGDLGAWNKLQLGWLNYEVGVVGQTRTLELGPGEFNTARAQGLVVVLPDKEVTRELGPPYAGANQFWSGSGNDLDNNLVRQLDLQGNTTAALSLKARYEIEEGFDYLYAQVSTDGGSTWQSLDGTVDGAPFPVDGSGTPALHGSTGGEWVDVNIPLDALVGGQPLFRFHYATDGGLALDGFFADDITLTADGQQVFQDGAEGDTSAWTFEGFSVTTGTETGLFDNFYIAVSRSYRSYDQYLKTGPYNRGFPDRPNFAEHFSYQQGLLITYWDTSQADNNTSEHPGRGLSLPIDAHPKPIYNLEGDPWRGRILLYDAPFGLRQPDSFTLHINGKPSFIRGGDPRPVFDDTKTWWHRENRTTGVKTPKAGVKIEVLNEQWAATTIRLSPS